MSIKVADVPVNVADFIRQFYRLSDTRDANEKYVEQFAFQASDFEFQIGPMKPVHDRDDVLAWRKKAWEVVAKRTHHVHAVFFSAGSQTIDASSPECMLYGRVEYEKTDGSKAGADWGGHIVFDAESLKPDGKPKMRRYHVWVVSIESRPCATNASHRARPFKQTADQ